ncbi:MAG: trehalose-phosphatase [Sphingobium sp.]
MTTDRSDPPPVLAEGISLFLDLDGTLLDLVDHPDAVVADDDLRDILSRLRERMAGRVAIVSGRSVQQLDRILGDVAEDLALSGSHGGEWRVNGETFRPPMPPALIQATDAMRDFARKYPAIFLEEKCLGTGFHFRAAPELEEEAVGFARLLAEEFGLFLQEGKMMAELRPVGHDKGSAIRGLMELPPLVGALPVFAGDDVTDESGFAAVNDMGGYGVLVGEVRHSLARFRLAGPSAVREWLREFVQ